MIPRAKTILISLIIALAVFPVSANAFSLESDPFSASPLANFNGPSFSDRIKSGDLTSHGYDRARAYTSTDRKASQKWGSVPINCAGSGDHNYLVLYAYLPDKKLSNYRDVFGNLVNKANGFLGLAAYKQGGAARMRFLCASAGKIKINLFKAPSKTADGYKLADYAEKTLGYKKEGQNLLIFSDTIPKTGECGIGFQSSSNAVASPDHDVNYGATAAIVHRGCFDPWSTLHEMTHTMGGVAEGAPNETRYRSGGKWVGGGHCRDGLDIMCYDDGSDIATQRKVCAKATYDCKNDDYFNLRPKAGTYLATHWNVGSTYNEFLDIVLYGYGK